MSKKLFVFTIVLSLFITTAIHAYGNGVEPPYENSSENKPNYDEVMKEAARKYMDKERIKRELDNQAAFEQDFDYEFNITPEQVRKIQSRKFQMEQASQMPVPYSGKTRSQAVSLDPGSKIGVINCYPQYVSTIRILDNSGNPWPIVAYMVGNQGSFKVQKPDMEPKDTLMVSPSVNAGSTNLTLMLDNQEGEDPVPPLSLQLIVSPENKMNYDTVASIRVNRRGPRTSSPVMIDDSENFYNDPSLLAFLDGVPPKGALRMKTTDKTIDAWMMNDMLYVRSPNKIVWPAWTKSISSGEKNGTVYAYELPPVESIMLTGNKTIGFSKFSDGVNRAMQGR